MLSMAAWPACQFTARASAFVGRSCEGRERWIPRRPRRPSARCLRAWRLSANLTQEALAERAGVSPRAVQALERGETRSQRDPPPALPPR